MTLLSQYLEINKIKIHYLEAGQGQTLVIIPGWLGTAGMLKKTGELLAINHQVIITDLPGQGKSSKIPKGWQFYNYQEIFSEFFKIKNLSNIILVGHSLGGAIAAAVSINNPRVAKLIIVNSLGKRTPNLFKTRAKNIFTKLPGAEILVYLPGFIKNILFLHTLCIKRSLSIVLNLDISDQLKKITAETIILWGDQDDMLAVDYGQSLSKIINNSRFIIVKDAEHSWIITEPERFVNYINYLS